MYLYIYLYIYINWRKWSSSSATVRLYYVCIRYLNRTLRICFYHDVIRTDECVPQGFSNKRYGYVYMHIISSLVWYECVRARVCAYFIYMLCVRACMRACVWVCVYTHAITALQLHTLMCTVFSKYTNKALSVG